ncbi:RHS repeat domain-containing protein, partial [Pseudomonas lijiangensis]
LVEDTESDWWMVDVEDEPEPQLHELPLTSAYEYDDWGEQRSVTGPDGIERHKVQDPVKRTTTEWQAGMGKTVTVNNLFDKPDSIERLALDESRISLETTTYDGLGRTFGQFDALLNYREFSYDAFDRPRISKLPDKSEVERTYALHSSEDLPVSIAVDGVVVGEQTFDGLKRMTDSTIGGRVSRFEYPGGQLKPGKVHTPGGEAIDYIYQPQLGDQPIQRKTLSSTADYTYDLQSARLMSSKEQDQELERDYYSNGELKEERRRQGGEAYVMQYRYSLKGRLLGYTDVLGQVQTYSYDASGRIEQLSAGSLVSTFGYNAQGLLDSIVTVDSVQSLSISLEYDEAGREVLRSFTLPGGTTQQLAQVYDAVDHLKQRTLKEGSTVLRDETFAYDVRGRLELYTASGPDAPLDPQGKQIQSQTFTFDALDNILSVETVFAGGSNTAEYEYTRQDPTQLSAVRNSHADYPAHIQLDYDDNGNLTLDEVGRSLEYDALGRLLAVFANDGVAVVDYGYDAQDSLTRSSEAGVHEQRFYREGQLANQLQGAQQRTFIGNADTLLAERRGGAGDATLLLATDAKKTVMAEVDAVNVTSIEYSAYGHRSDIPAVDSRSAFNGELREPSTGWYLLGQGYRAYNPVLMRFHSPDSLSPFDRGGVNPYAYCLGDPVNYLDPDGHIPWWVGLVAGVAATVLTAGIAAPVSAALGITAATASMVGYVAGSVSTVATVFSVGMGVGSSLTSGGLSESLAWLSLGAGVMAGATGGLAIGVNIGASLGGAAKAVSSAGSSPRVSLSSASVPPKSVADDASKRFSVGDLSRREIELWKQGSGRREGFMRGSTSQDELTWQQRDEIYKAIDEGARERAALEKAHRTIKRGEKISARLVSASKVSKKTAGGNTAEVSRKVRFAP